MRCKKSWSLAIVFYSLLPLLLVLGGCAGSPPQNFYTLSAAIDPLPRTGTASYSVAVDRVTIPAVVDRPQIVTNVGPNRVTFAEQSRWAEPLKESIPRVMAEDLARLLPDAYVAAYPQTVISNPRFRVLLDVQRFESSQDTGVALDIVWVINMIKESVQITGRTFRREPLQGNGYEALAAAHGRALAGVSRDIAAVIAQKAGSRR